MRCWLLLDQQCTMQATGSCMPVAFRCPNSPHGRQLACTCMDLLGLQLVSCIMTLQCMAQRGLVNALKSVKSKDRTRMRSSSSMPRQPRYSRAFSCSHTIPKAHPKLEYRAICATVAPAAVMRSLRQGSSCGTCRSAWLGRFIDGHNLARDSCGSNKQQGQHHT